MFVKPYIHATESQFEILETVQLARLSAPFCWCTLVPQNYLCSLICLIKASDLKKTCHSNNTGHHSDATYTYVYCSV